jgi:hypothetical protein
VNQWWVSTVLAAAEGQRAQSGADCCHPRLCGALSWTPCGNSRSVLTLGSGCCSWAQHSMYRYAALTVAQAGRSGRLAWHKGSNIAHCHCAQAAGGVVYLLFRWLRPAPVDAKYEALPCRWELPCALGSLECGRCVKPNQQAHPGSPQSISHRNAGPLWAVR